MMTHRQQQNVRYWNDFCDELEARGQPSPIPDISKGILYQVRDRKKLWGEL